MKTMTLRATVFSREHLRDCRVLAHKEGVRSRLVFFQETRRFAAHYKLTLYGDHDKVAVAQLMFMAFDDTTWLDPLAKPIP